MVFPRQTVLPHGYEGKKEEGWSEENPTLKYIQKGERAADYQTSME